MNTLTTAQEQEIFEAWMQGTRIKRIKRLYDITDGEFVGIVERGIEKDENKRKKK